MTLLAHGREVAADTTKGRRSSVTAKCARNLLLDFDHPQIPLGLIVGKRDRQIVEKGQYLLGAP